MAICEFDESNWTSFSLQPCKVARYERSTILPWGVQMTSKRKGITNINIHTRRSYKGLVFLTPSLDEASTVLALIPTTTAICVCHMSSIVSVPVFVITYSATATSLPDSLPYPDCLMPPNGLSLADWFPARRRHINITMSIVRDFLPVFIPIMPASRFSNSLHVRSTFLVKKYEARPIYIELAIRCIGIKSGTLRLYH